MQFRIGRTSGSRVQPHPRAVPGNPLDKYPWTVEVASLEDLLTLFKGPTDPQGRGVREAGAAAKPALAVMKKETT